MEKQFEQLGTQHESTISDTRVISFLKSKNYFYPDVVVVDGEPIFTDEFKEIVANPQIIVEVLSETTESFDRSEKFRAYRSIESLKEYILISSEKRCIEQFFKDENNHWQIGEVIFDGSLTLHSAPFELNIDDIYNKVNFEKNEIDPSV